MMSKMTKFDHFQCWFNDFLFSRWCPRYQKIAKNLANSMIFVERMMSEMPESDDFPYELNILLKARWCPKQYLWWHVRYWNLTNAFAKSFIFVDRIMSEMTKLHEWSCQLVEDLWWQDKVSRNQRKPLIVPWFFWGGKKM